MHLGADAFLPLRGSAPFGVADASPGRCHTEPPGLLGAPAPERSGEQPSLTGLSSAGTERTAAGWRQSGAKQTLYHRGAAKGHDHAWLCDRHTYSQSVVN